MSNLAFKKDEEQFTLLQPSLDVEGSFYLLTLLTPAWSFWTYWVWVDMPNYFMLAINLTVLSYFAVFAFLCRQACSIKIHLMKDNLIVLNAYGNRFISFDRIEKVSIFNSPFYSFFKLHVSGEEPQYLSHLFKGSSQVLKEIENFKPSLINSRKGLSYTQSAIVSENFSQRVLDSLQSFTPLAVMYVVFPTSLLMLFSAYKLMHGYHFREILEGLGQPFQAVFILNTCVGLLCWSIKETTLMGYLKWMLQREPEIIHRTSLFRLFKTAQTAVHILVMSIYVLGLCYIYS